MTVLQATSRQQRSKKISYGKLRILRAIRYGVCLFVFLALHRWLSQRQNAKARRVTYLAPERDLNSSFSQGYRFGGRLTSLVFDKRAKTGSTSVNAILREMFGGKKFIECGLHSPAKAMKRMLKQTKTEGFDVFDCHIKTTWEDRQIIEQRAKTRVAWMTITRDPFERLMSHWKHALRAGDNPPENCVNIQLDQVLAFYQSVHRVYLDWEFGDVETLYNEVSTGKLCSRWDVILESETLAEDVSEYLGYTKLPKLNVTPSFCGNVTHDEALVVKAALRDEYLHHRALLACKKNNKRLRARDGNIILI